MTLDDAVKVVRHWVDALKELKGNPYDGTETAVRITREMMETLAVAAETVAQHQWQPYPEVKPSVGQPCFVWLEPEGGGGRPDWSIRRASYDVTKFIDHVSQTHFPPYAQERITHWMSLQPNPVSNGD